jgi:hypothetical protein
MYALWITETTAMEKAFAVMNGCAIRSGHLTQKEDNHIGEGDCDLVGKNVWKRESVLEGQSVKRKCVLQTREEGV